MICNVTVPDSAHPLPCNLLEKYPNCYVRVEICGALTVLKDSVDGTKPGEVTALYAPGQWLRCWMEPEEEKAP